MTHRDRGTNEGPQVWGNDEANPDTYGQHSQANATGESPEQIRERLRQEAQARGENPGW